MASTTIVTCDKCNNEIGKDEVYVAAGVYGKDCHLSCFENMSAPEAIVFLGIDDIKIMKFEDWQNATKANSYFRRNTL